MLSDERIKELADKLWDEIIHWQATQESVLAAFRAALKEAENR